MRVTTLCGAGLSLALGLMMVGMAEADARKARRYRPAKVGRFTGQTTTTGTRGFCEDSKTRLSLTAIAPLGHTGQSSVTHPTLVWFVPGNSTDGQTPYGMELVILKERKDQKQPRRQEVWKTTQLSSKPGFMQFKLPDEVKLLPEETYLWQIVLKCNPNLPSQDQIAEAPIQRILRTPGKPNQEPVSDLWYDLWAEAGISEIPEAKQLIQDLIEIEATPIAPEQRHNATQIQRQQDRLREILKTLEPVAHQDKR